VLLLGMLAARADPAIRKRLRRKQIEYIKRSETKHGSRRCRKASVHEIMSRQCEFLQITFTA
jgi:hypothetical protein